MARAFSPEAELAAAIGLLARLVAFDTVSSRSNRELIDAIAERLREHGVEPTLVVSDDPGKAGLLATIGPDVAGGVVLSGHTDVVPVAGQRWSSDPFVLVERDGRLFGRGAADMKGFLAAILALLPRLAATRLRLPIHLAFSHDEEVGCLGTPRLIETLLARRARPALAIVGEPTGMQVADRHRGITTYEARVTGRGGHSSAPARGVNAIALAARLVTELERRAAALAAAAEPDDRRGEAPEHTTLNVGEISGGSAVNMIAERCRLSWECRPAATTTAEAALQGLDRFVEDELLAPARRIAPGVGIAIRQVVSVPPLRAVADSPVVALAQRLTGGNTRCAAPFASEAGLFQDAGIAAVVCGPGRPGEAHQPDEFIERGQIAACLEMLRRLAAWAAC